MFVNGRFLVISVSIEGSSLMDWKLLKEKPEIEFTVVPILKTRQLFVYIILSTYLESTNQFDADYT